MDKEEYIEQRLNDQIAYYERAATQAKNRHMMFQTAIILLGLAVPVVVNLPPNFIPGEAGGIQALVTVMSLLLASFTGIANFRKYGELWLTYRATEEALKQEKFLLLTGSGPYRNPDTSFGEFVAKIESIISSEHIRFRSIVEESKRPTTPPKKEEAG